MTARPRSVSLKKVLVEHRDRIVALFVAEVQRQELPPQGVRGALLVDEIPRFLDETARELDQSHGVAASQDVVGSSATAREHGLQRWALGYDLEAVIREYGVLRHCILTVALDVADDLPIRELDILSKCLNVGVAEAAMAYSRRRDEELASEKSARTFLMEAGQVLSSSLDYRSTLTRLTQLLVPRLADWCAIYVQDMGTDELPIAHVDAAKLPLLRRLYREFSPLDCPLGTASVMATGEPVLVEQAGHETPEFLARTPERGELLRTVGVQSWMILPLRVQEAVFGCITLGYVDAGRGARQADLGFAEELSRRAAVAIDNARLYRRAQEERARFEAATRAKDEFVAMVSHELRTPMHSILGWLELFRRGDLPPEAQKRALEVIARNAKAQNQLIADLLDVSDALTGKLRIKPSQVDLTEVVEMAIEGVRPAADAKCIRIESDLDSDGAVLTADSERMRQVVWNLLTNAVKFTPKQGHVTVRLRRTESELELVVEDDGEGIAPEFLPYMFESFRQSDSTSTRPHGGLGLGLSITKHLVELHGGRIEGRSDGKGRGAAFTVRLPVAPLVSNTTSAKTPAARASQAERRVPPQLSGLRALVVEHDRDAQELLNFVLRDSDIDVRVASTAQEARQLFMSFEPHILISDVALPDEDGQAFIRSIRSARSASYRDIPAIALTAFAGDSDRVNTLLAGFNRHLAKPVDVPTLIATIIELTGHSPRDE